ncbi:MAG: hypothetical protein ACPHUL_00865 [Marinomonas gallaica]
MNNMDDIKYKQHKYAKRRLDWIAIVEYSNTHSNKETAKKFGCHPSMVTRIRKKMGAELRESTPNIAREIIDKAQMMRDEGEKIDVISITLGISNASISKHTKAPETIARAISPSKLKSMCESGNPPSHPVEIRCNGVIVGTFTP